ncbi:glutamate--tRNA ligase [Orientia chuto str. Dubai]|uniref:Glutamate--tRNA ligase n=1 Tax=Orientia chuto str. Dubai TaxID=1359168 RepID=A0A0F3MLN3_9RICK|nr:glutamate--tRNA ligase [Candidatus Orientia mediorientalis]KJV56635.1 glutamate--tRNA ligase [Orientia chuto str. Dubai]
MTNIVTRFAPSPTGFLHIGGARTALFNYLFARHYKGKFFLRIEDTDTARSAEEYRLSIINGLKWLKINWDNDVFYQSANLQKYVKIALELVKSGKAYYCFTTQEEIDHQRQLAIIKNQSFIFKSPWRNNTTSLLTNNNKPYVIRFKAPDHGITVINDYVQGKVVFQNHQIDDMILVRSNGMPTYMLAVVVDDHDMGITHIIRGDDHLTNAAKQIALYQALGWTAPAMAHIPLIYGFDGAKLSKRHGAICIEEYQKMGFLPEALCNYLLRLGWSYRDEEIISHDRAIELFNFDGLGKSAARLDFDKMLYLNGYYIRNTDALILTKLVIEILSKQYILSNESCNLIEKGMPGLKSRANLIHELAENAKIYVLDNNLTFTNEALNIIQKTSLILITEVTNIINNLPELNYELVKQAFIRLAQIKQMKLGQLMEPIRALLTGNTKSPSVFEIIPILGKVHTIKRLANIEAIKNNQI